MTVMAVVVVMMVVVVVMAVALVVMAVEVVMMAVEVVMMVGMVMMKACICANVGISSVDDESVALGESAMGTEVSTRVA